MAATSARASGTGLRLLHELLETSRGGRVFTSDEAVAAGEARGLSPGHVYKLLSDLTRHEAIHRPRGHLYVMQPPFGGSTPVRPLAIAVRAADPAAVSGDTALVHWELLEQAPLHEEEVSTPARIQWTHDVHIDGSDRLWTVEGSTIRFRHVPMRDMVGIRMVRLDGETVVPMFDRERAVLELLAAGSPAKTELAAELIDVHRDGIDLARMRRYAEHLGITTIPGADHSHVSALR